MDKGSLELFKQALSEGVSNRFDKIAAECTEEIVCSDKHHLIMQTIVYGKTTTKRGLSPSVKRIIAILVAAALLLTSCGIIFRNELREAFNNFFVTITYKDEPTYGTEIENVYQLSYVPEGYSLKDEKIRPLRIQYEFANDTGDFIWFEQQPMDGTDFYIDSENGYAQLNDIKDFEIYYRYTGEKHVYIWTDGIYSMKLASNIHIYSDEIVLIFKGLTVK